MLLENSDRAPERNLLVGELTDVLRIILKDLDKLLPGELIEPLSLSERAQDAIEKAQPNQDALIRQYMTELVNKIAEMNPKFAYLERERCYEQLRNSINDSTGLAVEFAQLAESIAMMNAGEAAKAMYKGFGNILNLYTFSPDYQGSRREFERDFPRFLGHELFVIFFSYLLRNDRWELITEILDEDLYARKANYERPNMVPFHHLSETVLKSHLKGEMAPEAHCRSADFCRR